MIQIENKSDCCGCTACSNICLHGAIKMRSDEEGFYYPDIDASKCIDCGLCERVCPIIEYDKIKNKDASPVKIYGLTNKNNEIYNTSSSGGVFTEIANYVIELGGVVVGVGYDNNMVVKHIIATTKNDLNLFRGSKYVQSDIQEIYVRIKDFLKQQKIVLFTGTPCQVEGLKLFLRRKYDNLITIDLVCHAVPSPKIFKNYVSFIEKRKKKKVVSIIMRDKAKGWSNEFHYRVVFEDGSFLFDTELTNLWSKIFFSQLVNRPSCHSCRFTNFLRPGDYTLADFWGIHESYPEKFQGKGVSLLLINTFKGEEIFKNIKNHFDYFEAEKDKCIQPCLLSPTKAVSNRSLFWQDYQKYDFKYLAEKYWGFTPFQIAKKKIRQSLHVIKMKIVKL